MVTVQTMGLEQRLDAYKILLIRFMYLQHQAISAKMEVEITNSICLIYIFFL